MNAVTGIVEESAPMDVTNLLGEWENVNVSPDYLASLQIRETEGGRLQLRIPDPMSAQGDCMGEFDAIPFAARESAAAGGFLADFRRAGAHTMIAANEKLGVLVLQSYTHFEKENGRRNRLTREFYRRKQNAGSHAKEEMPESGVGHDDLKQQTRHEDFALLAGLWRNTSSDTAWAKELSINLHDDQQSADVVLQNPGSKPSKALAKLYEFDSNEMGFSTQLNAEALESTYVAYSNKGLIVLSGYHYLKADERKLRLMSREFYYAERNLDRE